MILDIASIAYNGFFCVLEIIDNNDMADTLAVDSEWTCFIASWALVADIFFFQRTAVNMHYW